MTSSAGNARSRLGYLSQLSDQFCRARCSLCRTTGDRARVRYRHGDRPELAKWDHIAWAEGINCDSAERVHCVLGSAWRGGSSSLSVRAVLAWTGNFPSYTELLGAVADYAASIAKQTRPDWKGTRCPFYPARRIPQEWTKSRSRYKRPDEGRSSRAFIFLYVSTVLYRHLPSQAALSSDSAINKVLPHYGAGRSHLIWLIVYVVGVCGYASS